MKKYFFISYYSFKQACKYKVNNILNIVSSIIFIMISFYIWNSVYLEQGSEFVLSLETTITYVVIIAIINRGICTDIEMEIGRKVISGDIVVDLLHPISYAKYIFFNNIGKIIFNVIYMVIPLVLFSGIILKARLHTEFILYFYFFISVILSIILVCVFEITIGLISFLTSQIFGISLIKNSIYNIFSGIVIPLSFYPNAIRHIVINLPFQAMFYIPVSIFCGFDNSDNFLQCIIKNISRQNSSYIIFLIEQIIWILLLGGIYIYVWKRCLKRLVVQGG